MSVEVKSNFKYSIDDDENTITITQLDSNEVITLTRWEAYLLYNILGRELNIK
jgi:hypothetical protein